MKKITLNNAWINIVVGILLTAFAILSYFLEWYTEFLSIIIGVVILILSVRRFIKSYQKVISKYSTTILIVELLLDFVIVGLMMYYKTNIAIYVGAIIYIRGVSYLVINYITTRKIFLLQYMANIFFVTLGSFLVFTSIDLLGFLEYLTLGLVIVIGVFYLVSGIVDIAHKSKTKKQPSTLSKSNTLTEETKKSIEAKQPSKPVDYESKTVAELRAIAKERGLRNLSQLKKQELIDLIKEYNK